MTLGKIKVKNFQSIEDGEVELGSFTVFTGPSSSGKSALLRAANALVRNNFTPSQVTMGKDHAEVSVELEEHVVTAIRGKGKSTYVLNDEKFTKAGRSVPDKILEVFSMDEISGVESTFSTQFDRPYLIAESGSVASKVLGSLTNVSVLHRSLQETNRRALEVRSRLKVKDVDLKEVSEHLQEYDDIHQLKETLREAIILDQELDSLQEEYGVLVSLMSAISKTEDDIDRNIITQVDLEPIETLLSEATLELQDAKTLDDGISTANRIAAEYPTWDFESVQDLNLDSIGLDLAEVTKLSSVLDNLSSLASSITENMSELDEILTRVQDHEAEYGILLEGFELCPLCNSAIHL